MGKSFKTPRVALRLFGVQLIIIAISVMFMGSYDGFLTSTAGRHLYSTITALIYLGVYYSRVWHAGRGDMKNAVIHNRYNEDKIYPKYSKGLIVGILAQIPNIIVLLILIYTASTGSESAATFNATYRILQSGFVGLFSNDIESFLTNIPGYIVVIIIPILLGIPAYFAGVKDFSVVERYLPVLVYKKEEDNKNK